MFCCVDLIYLVVVDWRSVGGCVDLGQVLAVLSCCVLRRAVLSFGSVYWGCWMSLVLFMSNVFTDFVSLFDCDCVGHWLCGGEVCSLRFCENSEYWLSLREFYSLWLWVTMIVCDSRFFTVWGYWRILHICCLYESWYPLQSLFTINVCESSFSLLVVIGGFYTFVVRTRVGIHSSLCSLLMFVIQVFHC